MSENLQARTLIEQFIAEDMRYRGLMTEDEVTQMYWDFFEGMALHKIKSYQYMDRRNRMEDVKGNPLWVGN